jgi:hypothetical protein
VLALPLLAPPLLLVVPAELELPLLLVPPADAPALPPLVDLPLEPELSLLSDDPPQDAISADTPTAAKANHALFVFMYDILSPAAALVKPGQSAATHATRARKSPADWIFP